MIIIYLDIVVNMCLFWTPVFIWNIRIFLLACWLYKSFLLRVSIAQRASDQRCCYPDSPRCSPRSEWSWTSGPPGWSSVFSRDLSIPSNPFEDRQRRARSGWRPWNPSCCSLWIDNYFRTRSLVWSFPKLVDLFGLRDLSRYSCVVIDWDVSLSIYSIINLLIRPFGYHIVWLPTLELLDLVRYCHFRQLSGSVRSMTLCLYDRLPRLAGRDRRQIHSHSYRKHDI